MSNENQRRRGSQQQRRPRPDPGQAAQFWRSVPESPAPDPIRPAAEPAALVRSLGTPPLPGQGASADHYVAAVVERAAALATALAAAGGLLGGDDRDEA